ncbi:PadR family transcriptional regulator [Neobacillus mesonae]|nr:PadR family transcriptional regulator [Neobacillus mesonae]
MKENQTPYAVLGLLAAGCHTGYSIKQMMDNSLNHFWKISYGQIYPALKWLVEEGYATVQAAKQDGKPDKKEYFITKEGDEALKLWLSDPVRQLPTERNELLLKLFFSRNQDLDTTLNQLDVYYEKLRERHRTYEGIKEMISTCLADQQDAPYWMFTIDYGLSTSQAAIDWCVSTRKWLQDQKEER